MARRLTPEQAQRLAEQEARHARENAQRDESERAWAAQGQQASQFDRTLAQDAAQHTETLDANERAGRWTNEVGEGQLAEARKEALRLQVKAYTDQIAALGMDPATLRRDLPLLLDQWAAENPEATAVVLQQLDSPGWVASLRRAANPPGESLDRLVVDQDGGPLDYLLATPNLARNFYNESVGRDVPTAEALIGEIRQRRQRLSPQRAPGQAPAAPNGPAPNPLSSVPDAQDTDWRSRGEVPSTGPRTYVGPNDGPRGPAEELLEFLVGPQGSSGVRGQLAANNPGMSPADIASILRRDYSQAAFERGQTPQVGFGPRNQQDFTGVKSVGPGPEPERIVKSRGPEEPVGGNSIGPFGPLDQILSRPQPTSGGSGVADRSAQRLFEQSQAANFWTPQNEARYQAADQGMNEGIAADEARRASAERQALDAWRANRVAQETQDQRMLDLARGGQPSGGSGVADRSAQRLFEQSQAANTPNPYRDAQSPPMTQDLLDIIDLDRRRGTKVEEIHARGNQAGGGVLGRNMPPSFQNTYRDTLARPNTRAARVKKRS